MHSHPLSAEPTQSSSRQEHHFENTAAAVGLTMMVMAAPPPESPTPVVGAPVLARGPAQKKQLIARIDPALHSAIGAVAHAEGLTLTDYVERALRADLFNRKDAAAQIISMARAVEQIQQDVLDDKACDITMTPHVTNTPPM